MAGPARDDNGVRFRRELRITGPARRPGPVAIAVLAAVALAGCGSGIPSASSGPGRSVVASAATRGSSGTASKCARWPAGSGRTILLISQASNGQQYCLHPGQSVQVFLGGTLSPVDGAEPPRLAGTGLVPASSGPAHLLRSPAATYQAVRAGREVLTIVRRPCHSVPPARTPAGGPDGTEGAGPPDGGPDDSGAATSANAVETVYTGGAPVGVQCGALQRALRVVVIVS